MKRIFIFIFPVLSFLIGSCNKEKDRVISSPSAFFAKNMEDAKQVFTIDPTIYNSLQGVHGTLVQISPNSFVDGQGELVVGDVRICLIEIYDKATLFMLNRSTDGVRESGAKDILKSGGQYSMTATQNGQAVFLSQPVVVKMPVDNTGGYDEEMRKFVGNQDVNGLVEWQMANDSTISLDTVQTELGPSAFYSLFDNGLWTWVNCDHWLDDPRPKTNLKVFFPEGYNWSNCQLVMSVDEEPMVLSNLNWIEDHFTYSPNRIPIGMDCHFIAITIIDDEVHYAIQAATIAEDHVETISEFIPTTKEELADLISALP